VDSVEEIGFLCSTANAAAHAAAMDHDFIHNKLNQAEAVFIAGGDQWEYIHLWHGTPVAAIIESRYNAGQLVVGGTSAGADVLSDWVYSAQGLSSEHNPGTRRRARLAARGKLNFLRGNDVGFRVACLIGTVPSKPQ
jgi:cyanophycinase-like exopeptidase